MTNNNAEDKPIISKKKKTVIIIVSIVAILLIIGAISRLGKQPENVDESEQLTTEQRSEEAISTNESESSNDEKGEPIVLVAGEQGEYGYLITLNAETELEETYFVYRLPAGTYTVTLTGSYMDQFNVYGETVYITEYGWEELSDCYYCKIFNPGESDTVTIEDGQIIEINGSGVWELTLN